MGDRAAPERGQVVAAFQRRNDASAGMGIGNLPDARCHPDIIVFVQFQVGQRIVGVRVVRENHEIMLQSRDGVMIRVRADGISRHGRATQGVKVMNMREGDVVSAIARMVVSESGATDEEIEAG